MYSWLGYNCQANGKAPMLPRQARSWHADYMHKRVARCFHDRLHGLHAGV